MFAIHAFYAIRIFRTWVQHENMFAKHAFTGFSTFFLPNLILRLFVFPKPFGSVVNSVFLSVKVRFLTYFFFRLHGLEMS